MQNYAEKVFLEYRIKKAAQTGGFLGHKNLTMSLSCPFCKKSEKNALTKIKKGDYFNLD